MGRVNIAGYSLGQQLRNDPRLVELGPVEYEVLGWTFEQERIFKAGHIEFLGRPAELVIGTVDGRICKLALQFVADSVASSAALLSEISHFCEGEFGPPAGTPDDATVIWDTDFGKVILETRSMLGQHFVNLYFAHAFVFSSAKPIARRPELQERFRQARRGAMDIPAEHADVAAGFLDPFPDELDQFLFRNLNHWVSLAWHHGIVKPVQGMAFGTHLATYLLCPPGGEIKGLHWCWLVKEGGTFFKARGITRELQTLWLFRYRTLRKFHLSELTPVDLDALQLPDLSGMDSAAPELRAFRELRELDEFRYPGRPDHVRAAFGPDSKLDPTLSVSEHVWVRVTGVIDNSLYRGVLLNTARFRMGAAGDHVLVRFFTVRDKKALVAFPPSSL
jgi:hypothetical protein